MNHLIIVESPAKAKTLKKFLGAKYTVKASMGHIRDLPKKNLAIDVDNNFEPDYEISPDKKKVVAELKKEAKKTDTLVWLASDEDREGESIAWHLMHALKLKKNQFKRIAFHEITKPAILKALENPRDIDIDLVHAQQARRVLDRLVGYKLSPLLWKKVQVGLSAGRVQSVAVRLIVDREREIEAFNPEEYWKIQVDFESEEAEKNKAVQFLTDLHKIKGKKAVVGNKKQADTVLSDLNDSSFKISKISKKTTHRKPSAPFITSTLQQEASRKLGYSVKQTMVIAQQLYEGISHGGDHTGLITYMRTDSFNLSKEFLKLVLKVIEKEFGKEYTLKTPRVFIKKAKGAQEAHEAIRPTDASKTPESLKNDLDPRQYKLYKLIWERTIAGQMPDADLDTTTVTVEASKGYELTAKGQVIKNPGFMKVYIESSDNPEEALSNKDILLPPLKEGADCDLIKIHAEQKFTQPPARYTEASLVKKMESEGIGRPSTYAPTISTIMNRGYVEKKEDKKLHPQDIGIVVNDFLVKEFGDIIDYKFTANLEEKLDEVAEGKHEWQPLVRDFFNPFQKTVEYATEHSERVTGERILGKDPKTGKPLSVRIGRYGPMAQIGTKDDEEKPRFAKLLPDQQLASITLKEALELFTLPRAVGEFEDEEVIAAIGRFGPYLKHKSKFYSLKEPLDPHSIKIKEAIQVIKEKQKEDANKQINHFEKGDIYVLNGRYGAYIKANKRNYKIPKDKEAEKLTLEDCEEIIKNAPPPGRRFARKKKS